MKARMARLSTLLAPVFRTESPAHSTPPMFACAGESMQGPCAGFKGVGLGESRLDFGQNQFARFHPVGLVALCRGRCAGRGAIRGEKQEYRGHLIMDQGSSQDVAHPADKRNEARL